MSELNNDRPEFFSITTIGERGQVVIPKDVRLALNLAAGDKLIVLPSKRGNGILLMGVENIKELAHELGERADHMSKKSIRLQQKLEDVEKSV